jgi:hypothetical protein
MVSYLPQIQSVYVDFNYLSGTNFECTWFNPTTGKKEASFMINKKSVQRVSPTHGEDWVLIVEGK